MKAKKNTHKKNSFGKALAALFASCAVLCLLFLALAWYALSPVSPDAQSVSPNGGESVSHAARFDVPQGSSARAVAKMLKETNLIRSEYVFYLYARMSGAVLKAGTYSVSPAMRVKDILALLTSGKSAHIAVSVPEGFTINKIAALLEKNGVCASEDFLAAAYDESLLKEYEIPGDSFQGYLFPDTYFFVLNMRGERVVRMMADTFYEKLSLISAAQKLSPRHLYEAVTLASIVEREYRVDSEAPLIASVFANRIKENWGLYSCATVEFIITEIQGKPHPDIITVEDTRIENPYNTYLWAGLPPGPISSPGLIALNAALSPADTKYYYFRLSDPESGRHHFSTNFTEHVEIGREVPKRVAGI
jgi:UPF0755 protein